MVLKKINIILFFNVFLCFSKEFKDLNLSKKLYLYAGDINFYDPIYKKFIGLSLNKSDQFHIKFDITNPFPIPSESIEIFQAEDVFEHIEYSQLTNIINEIYRILKNGGRLRLSIPDYRCDILINRSLKDENGNIIFDIGGGGKYINGKVINGGHVWFPTIEKVRKLLNKTLFRKNGKIVYYHYYETDGTAIMNNIDYSYRYVKRTPDHDKRVKNPVRPMSIVVDCIKN